MIAGAKSIISFVEEMRDLRARWKGSVALIPTMGYLHEGHLSLVRRAREENDHVVVSVFVNPAQFGPEEDFKRYPRDLERDMMLLEPLEVDAVWTPREDELYPEGFQTYVMPGPVSELLEGRYRPGHFKGVATVVAKLFHVAQPHRAYFGQKDAQQVCVIRRMVEDLNFPVRIEVCPTLREADGLALSSRNTYLNRQERKAACAVYRALEEGRNAYGKGERQSVALKLAMMDILEREPLARIQYLSIASPATMQELEWVDKDALFSMALFVGSTRLIDNYLLEKGRWNTGARLG